MYSCEYTHCVGLFSIVPPQGCEAILIKILQSLIAARCRIALHMLFSQKQRHVQLN